MSTPKVLLETLLEEINNPSDPAIAFEAAINMLDTSFELNDALNLESVHMNAYEVATECAITFEDQVQAPEVKKNLIQKVIEWFRSIISLISTKIGELIEKIKSIFKGKTAKQKVQELKASGTTECNASVNEDLQKSVAGFESLDRKRKIMDSLRKELSEEESKWKAAVEHSTNATNLKQINEFATNKITEIRAKYSEKLAECDEEFNKLHGTTENSSPKDMGTLEPIKFGVFDSAADYIDYAKKHVMDMKQMIVVYNSFAIENQKNFYNTTNREKQQMYYSNIMSAKHMIQTLTKNINQYMQNIANAAMMLNSACRVG